MRPRYDHRKGLRYSRLSDYRLVTIVVVVVVALGLILFTTHKASPLPKAITKQVSYLVYFPQAPWAVAKNTIQYAAAASAITMKATADSNSLTVTEQPTPSQFTDIAAYYPALLDKLNEYQSFGSSNGTVYLTRPTELQGGTEAVLNNDGTLLFVHPMVNLSIAQWRQFFNNLNVIK